MAAAALGTKRTFAAMHEEDGRCHGWACSTPSSSEREQRASSSNRTCRSARPRIGADDIYASHLNDTRIPMPSNRSTPTPMPTEHPRSFDASASVVLIGIRGTGKSTLAVMASVGCQRRVVDIENLFQEATGFSTAKYRRQFGGPNHNLRQEEVLRTALHAHDQGAIIVCNGSSLERSGQVLLAEYAKTHPVIHVVRDLQSIHDHLRVWDLSKLQDLLALSGPIFRRCSNYEFYNISETRAANSVAPANQSTLPPFLTLKRAERTFLKFLSLILAQGNAKGNTPPLEPGFPLSDIRTELRKYTCAVQTPLSVVVSEDADIEDLEFGSDAFEIVIEHLDPAIEPNPSFQGMTTERAEQISRSISRVRRSTVVPIIYHVMPHAMASSGGDPGRSSYLDHVRHGLRLAPEYATINLALDENLILDIIRSRGSTKIIGHLHAPVDWYDSFWLENYEKAMLLGCNAVRFTRPANFMDDNAAIQSFRNRISQLPKTIPLICFNTGRSGRRSACFNQVLTSVVPESLRSAPDFATRVEANPETSWLTAREATHALYASFTYDPMQFYIMGASAGYSLSPAMHNAAYKACGMPHNFQTLQTTTLNKLQDLVQDPHFGGTAVSLPFKIEVISLTHSISRHARAIGAVNTLIPVRHLNEDGSIPEQLDLFHERNQAGPVMALYGENTDWIGIRACIRRGLSPANAVRPSSCGLIIGSGGMARAAVYAMLQLGVKNIVIFNRTYENAEKLVAHFDRLVSSPSNSPVLPPISRQGSQPVFRILRSREDLWPTDLKFPTIILSCIPTHPVGDSPAPEFTLPTQWIESPTGGVVLELAYRTLNTPLMKQVRGEAHRSWICLDGLDLLPEQGFAQFELFTGKRAPRRRMREEVLRAWRDDQGRPDPGMVQTRLEAIDDQEP
ncbi:type I 3-dehydroquinase-domain-containing protein [Clohesyomyces aquaticus]|uniref:Type I 3-dehydroquinase-domain-containing protein n=1 Tax=Clohesyomyces aquaticus TaxID=1231657 RepID=A0A1Y1ZK75_9PLEO|nr:type I 3-dehydroquinase-domain-containing protein [Clohesyomyces aquaticus]